MRTSSSVEKKPFASSGTLVRSRAARRSSQLPPKRCSSTRIETAAAPAHSYASAIRAGSASGRKSPIDGERRLTSAIARRPGADRASRKRPISRPLRLL
jgi:hypothetical protein